MHHHFLNFLCTISHDWNESFTCKEALVTTWVTRIIDGCGRRGMGVARAHGNLGVGSIVNGKTRSTNCVTNFIYSIQRYSPWSRKSHCSIKMADTTTIFSELYTLWIYKPHLRMHFFFQVHAWEIADQLLSLDNETEYINYFAAQTMHTKVCTVHN